MMANITPTIGKPDMLAVRVPTMAATVAAGRPYASPAMSIGSEAKYTKPRAMKVLLRKAMAAAALAKPAQMAIRASLSTIFSVPAPPSNALLNYLYKALKLSNVPA